MQSLCLTLCRLTLAAWVGAAALFVVTSVREQTEAAFDSTTRDTLALIRFPWYYSFGFALVGTALVCGAAALTHPVVTRRRMAVVVALTAAALAVMAVDYIWVYRPLAALITPAGQTRPAAFATYHNASEHINELHLTLSLIAAIVACWPRRTSEE